jgi:membrane protein
MGRVFGFAKRVFSEWSRHDAPHLGAALAFYAILSLSPLVLLVIALAGMFVGRSEALQGLTAQIHGMVGPVADQALTSTLKGAQEESHKGWIASAISLLVVLFSASGIFTELRTALNKIWEVEAPKASGIWGMLRERLLSFGMVLSLGFLFVSSLIASAGLAAISAFMGTLVPMPKAVAVLLDLVISLGGLAVVFALMFKYVSAATVPWRAAWRGGALTALLFTIGKYLLGLYISKAAVGSEFGAAGSVIVMIVWIYYTAQIVFFGAEFTHVWQTEAMAGHEAQAGQRSALTGSNRMHSQQPRTQ